jgi:hypothetical protein
MKQFRAYKGLLEWPCQIKVNLKIPISIPAYDKPESFVSGRWLLMWWHYSQPTRKMTCREWPNPGSLFYQERPNPGWWLTDNGQIPAYDKPGIGQAPEHQLPWSDIIGKSICKIYIEDLMKTTVCKKHGCSFFPNGQSHLTGLANSYKMTCWRQEKSCKVTLTGQDHPSKWFYAPLGRLYH